MNFCRLAGQSPHDCRDQTIGGKVIRKHLRAIRADIGNMGEKIDNLTQRVGSMEKQTAIIHDDPAGIQARLDSHEKRMGRIEKRLELTSV